MWVRWVTSILVAMSTVVWAPCAVAQQPPVVGPEFQVNTYTTLGQNAPAVAADGDGSFVVVWVSDGSAGSDTDGLSIQGQRYDASGTPQGAQFQVNTYTAGGQNLPAVATDGAGNFVVVWESAGSPGSDTSGDSIQGQRYDHAGTPQGGQFQVNTYTTGFQGAPAVAADGTGNLVVVWNSSGGTGTDTSGGSIHGQRFVAGGNPQGGEFQVNTYTTSLQDAPAVAADGAGNFMVVWHGVGGTGSDASDYAVNGQRYDGAGVPQGGEFQVNTYTTSKQYAAAVAADGAGNFVVVWQSFGGTGSDAGGPSIQAQRYDGGGTPQGGQFQVNTYATGSQQAAAVAADATGSFVVVWQSYGGDGSDADIPSIQGQLYDAAGAPQGTEFQVNTYTTGFQQRPSVALGAADFVVTWQSAESAGPDTDNFSVAAQRFGVPTTSSTTSTTLPTTDLLPGRIVVVRRGALAKFVAKPVSGGSFTRPTADPVTAGGSLRLFDASATAGDETYTLPAGVGWKGLGRPAGSKGYRYAGAGTPADPCTLVLVKAGVIKGVCRGSGIGLTPPFGGAVGVVLSVGTTDRYCAEFGGRDVRNEAKLTKRKKAPAAAACPP